MRSPAAMRLRLDGTGDADAVVRFFEAREYLAAKRGRELVEITPLIALSEGADRRRVQRLLTEWQRENPTARIELLDGAP